jgi:DNA repair protein RadD
MSELVLRDYQVATVAALRDALNRGVSAPCVSVATGGGKTVIIAALAKELAAKGHHIVVLTHSRELIRQLDRTLCRFLDPSKVGVIAAGLGRKDEPRQVQICQIQSVGRNPDRIGPRRIVIVDELQSVNHEQGQYLTTIEHLRVKTPDLRLIGLSATPFRTTTGLCYGKGRMFDECVHRVGMRELIDAEWLTPIIGKTGDKDFKVEGVAMRGGDFKPDELEKFMADQSKVDRAVADMMPRMEGRRQVLVFTTGLKHNAMIVDAIKKYDSRVESIDGTMENNQRDSILNRFANGTTRFVPNCAILTTGYDDSGIDGIVMLRPTRSPGLLIQCAGRGLRKRDGKPNCLFLDYGGSLSHFGPLDQIEENITLKKRGPPGKAPTKVCDCGTVLHLSAIKCPDCGKEFPRQLNHAEQAADEPVLSDEPKWVEVKGLQARRHQKQGSPPCLRIDYLDGLGLPVANEWLSVHPEANLYAYQKSINALTGWPNGCFKKLGDTLYYQPATGGLTKLDFDGIVAHAAWLPPPSRVRLLKEGKYWRVTKKEFQP